MNQLEKEIMDLSGRWCKYVGLDHCKSRDFYWYITKTYAYGEAPKYYAYHNGYRADDWRSVEVDSEEDAMGLLADKLRKTVNSAIKTVKKEIEYVKKNPEEMHWQSIEELEKELAALEGKKIVKEHSKDCDSAKYILPTDPPQPAKCTCGVE